MTLHSSPRATSVRDRAIVETVARFHQVTAAQLRRLYFADGSDASRAVRQRRVLARLVRDGHLARLPRPIGGGDAGSGGYVYIPIESRARVANPHTLEIIELYVRLVEAERTGVLRVLDVAPEPYCHVYLDGVVLKPDCYLRLQTSGATFRFFVEIDLGTEWRPQLRAKMRTYTRAFERWTEPTFPKALFVAPDDLRRTFLAGVVARQPNPDLFAVATFDTVIADLAGAS